MYFARFVARSLAPTRVRVVSACEILKVSNPAGRSPSCTASCLRCRRSLFRFFVFLFVLAFFLCVVGRFSVGDGG